MHDSSPADWQLPPGVSRGLWDYAHNEALAKGYDAGLEGSSLFRADLAFVDAHAGPPGDLIDLGCGTGRLLVPMAHRGWRCLGVDLSPTMLAVARDKALKEGVRFGLLRADLARLGCIADGSFDAACCLFSTLGMIGGEKNRTAALAHAFRLLRPGGRMVLHVHNKWFNAWNPVGRRWLLGDVARSWLTWTRGGDRAMPVHQGVAGLSLHLFTRSEALGLVRGAGFRILEAMPLGLGEDARLPWPWWFGWLRAYGWLIAAQKP